MIKDVLKIIKIYLKNYIVPIVILLLGFALFATISSSKQLNTLKYEIANYEFEKNTGVQERQKANELSNLDEKEKRIREIEADKSSYIVNYNGKISKDDFEYLLHRYAVGAYLGELSVTTSSTFYKPDKELDASFGEFNKEYEKYLTKDEKDNADKYKVLKKLELGSRSYEELEAELGRIYPKVLGYTQGKIYNFADENLGKSKVEIKEILYSIDISLGYYILISLISLLIFGVEYHTNFGKFIASLPFKKERVYFSKLILSLLILLSAFFIVGIANVFVVKASVLGDVYSLVNSFLAQSKVFYLGIGLIFIGAILASFCGSVLSIGMLYLPVVGLLGYFIIPTILVLRVLGKEGLLDKVNLTDVNNYIPLFYYFKYVETKYIVIWFVVLSLLTLLMSKVYKGHKVEREGRFFMQSKVEIIGYIVLLIGVLSFSLILFNEIFNFNLVIIAIISLMILPYLLWKIMRFKIRI